MPQSMGRDAETENHRSWLPVIELSEKCRSDRELIEYSTSWLGYAANPQFSSISVKILGRRASGPRVCPTILISVSQVGVPEQAISSGAFVWNHPPRFMSGSVTSPSYEGRVMDVAITLCGLL